MFLETEKRPQGEQPFRENTHEGLDTASKLLLRAAALIEERGLCQGVGTDGSGRLCMLAALGAVEGCGSWAVHEATGRMHKAVGWPCYLWNDVPGRTKEEVVAKLRAVALGG